MNKLRFLVVRRPGIYNTHSHVIQPMEHTLVNDGLPLLFKQFKANVRTWIKIYLPHCKSIDFEDISLEDANKYIETPEKLKTDYDGASILLNHPQQYKFTSFNMEQLYVAISDNSWHLTPNTLDFFGGTDYISTCLNYTNTNNNCKTIKIPRKRYKNSYSPNIIDIQQLKIYPILQIFYNDCNERLYSFFDKHPQLLMRQNFTHFW
eukprot:208789_1